MYEFDLTLAFLFCHIKKTDFRFEKPSKGIVVPSSLHPARHTDNSWSSRYPDLGHYSPVPRHSFAHIFDTKLREMSFEKQNSAKAVLFTMYVSTAGAKTFYHRKT